MPKTEVYSWRVSPSVKSRLEDASRKTGHGVAALLDAIVTEHLEAEGRRHGAHADQQRLLHARAAEFAGCLTGSDPERSAHVRRRVRTRLRARRAHVR